MLSVGEAATTMGGGESYSVGTLSRLKELIIREEWSDMFSDRKLYGNKKCFNLIITRLVYYTNTIVFAPLIDIGG